jgi:hypothetical protein
MGFATMNKYVLVRTLEVSANLSFLLLLPGVFSLQPLSTSSLHKLSPQALSTSLSFYLTNLLSAIKRSAAMEKVDTYQPIGRNDKTSKITFRVNQAFDSASPVRQLTKLRPWTGFNKE